MTTLFACGQETVTHGLEIVEDHEQVAELTTQEVAQLDDAVYEVLQRVVDSDMSTFAQAIEDNLQKIAQYVAQEVALLQPNQEEYAALMFVLQRYLDAENFSAGMLADNFYIDLMCALGKDKCAALVHRFLLRYCDYRAQKNQQRYDQFVESFQLAPDQSADPVLWKQIQRLADETQRYRDKYQVLSTKLDPADLSAGLTTYYIVRVVCAMEGQTDTAGFLTTDEILLLAKAQKCTAVAMDADVWYELITLAQDFVTDKYYAKIMDAAVANGDARLLAEGMNDLVALVRYVQMTIEAEDIQAIQQGAPIANVILSMLTDDQLRQIDAFLSQAWHYDYYNDLAQKQCGTRYQQFVQQTQPLTLDQLLASRWDAPDAIALTLGYLAGKSYALAWEVQP